MSAARRLAARWILPGDAPPVAHAALLIDTDGRVAAIGPDAEVPAPPGVPADRWPDGVLLPGLVNAHTHLELTGLAGTVEHDDFTDWIRVLRERKAERSPATVLAAARDGVRAMWAAGVTTVADTGDSGAPLLALAELGGSGIYFQEVFGPHPDQCGESIAGLERQLDALAPSATGRVRLGVSPHAPYTVSGPLYAAASEVARRRGLPLAGHIAESPAESALLERAEGPFAAMWTRRGIPLPGMPGASPVQWVRRHGVLGRDFLAIHAVQLAPEDIATLAAMGVGVAHCPRSNRRHGHGDAPLRALLEAGIRLGVGTDSEVSCPIDLLAEVRAARELGRLSAERAFRLITVDAAEAIGVADVGRLSPGCWGDVAVVDGVGEADPFERVLASAPRDVAATFLSGSMRYCRDVAGT